MSDWIQTYFDKVKPQVPKAANEICPCQACDTSEAAFHLKANLQAFIDSIDWVKEATELAKQAVISDADSDAKRADVAWLIVNTGMARLHQLLLETMPASSILMAGESLDMLDRVFNRVLAASFVEVEPGPIEPYLPMRKVTVH